MSKYSTKGIKGLKIEDSTRLVNMLSHSICFSRVISTHTSMYIFKLSCNMSLFCKCADIVAMIVISDRFYLLIVELAQR